MSLRKHSRREGQLEKLVIVGEAPSNAQARRCPLEGKSGNRLAALAGMSFQELSRLTIIINATNGYARRRGKGRTINARAAKKFFANELLDMRPSIVLVLGKRLAHAAGLRKEYFIEQCLVGAKAYVFPHPSGVNRWFNDPANEFRACKFLRKLLTDGGGSTSR